MNLLSIEDDALKEPMKVKNILHKPLGNHHNIIDGVSRNEVSYLSQPIYYHEDGVMLKSSLWKPNDEIHADGLPFLSGYFQ